MSPGTFSTAAGSGGGSRSPASFDPPPSPPPPPLTYVLAPPPPSAPLQDRARAAPDGLAPRRRLRHEVELPALVVRAQVAGRHGHVEVLVDADRAQLLDAVLDVHEPHHREREGA